MDARERRLDTLLPHATLLAGLDDPALRAIESIAQPRYYTTGQVICRQGDPSDSLFVLHRGFAQAFVAPASGSAATMVARLCPGDVIGEIGVLAAVPRSATVVARSEAVALEISADDFARLLASHCRLQENLAHVLAGRLARRNADLHNGGARHVAMIVVGAGRRGAAVSVVAAARRASPRPFAIVDVRGDPPLEGPIPGTAVVVDASSSLPELLVRIDALAATHGTVVVVVDHDRIDTALLEPVDRVLAFVADQEAAALAPPLAAARQVADIVVFGGRALNRPEFRTLRRCDTVLAARDVAWLARHLARTKLGLALGAGGAKAFAHVGVIECLEREGYAIDYVAGSSMGAVVAVWLALGMTASEIEALLHDRFAPGDVVEAIFRRGAAGGGDEVFRRIFRETTRDRSFEDCVIPATVMTADLAARRPCPITTGSLWEALMASLAIPGLYPPWSQGEHRLVDAVCLTPVPVEAVVAARRRCHGRRQHPRSRDVAAVAGSRRERGADREQASRHRHRGARARAARRQRARGGARGRVDHAGVRTRHLASHAVRRSLPECGP